MKCAGSEIPALAAILLRASFAACLQAAHGKGWRLSDALHVLDREKVVRYFLVK